MFSCVMFASSIAQPYGMMATTASEKAIYEVDWLWGTLISLQVAVGLVVYKAAP